MKKFIIFIFSGFIFGSELTNYLSKDYNELFDTELQKSFYDSKFNSLSWISPIMLTYQKSWNNQIIGTWSPTASYSISISQPIFKSGGIYYGIKFAKANYNLSKVNILKKKKELIAKAIELLFNIEKLKLNIKKLNLQIANAQIEIKNRYELFKAELGDSIELDRAYAKKDEAQIALLEAKQNLQELISAFRKISYKNPNNLKLPHLSLLKEDEFLNKNLDIEVAKAKATSAEYKAKATRSKYLPTVTLNASYTKLSDISNPLMKNFLRTKYQSYSINVSMPISVNSFNDIERAKLDSLISKLELKNAKTSAKEDFNLIKNKISILNKKIALSKKEAKIYKRIYLDNKKLYKAGQRSIYDVKLFKNNYLMKNYDAKIYSIDKQIELLKLYSKIY